MSQADLIRMPGRPCQDATDQGVGPWTQELESPTREWPDPGSNVIKEGASSPRHRRRAAERNYREMAA